ncbi:unnamed protein product [Phyllotreta striolata]|uniref:GRIP domain-containing protein n=1 Tax=Phyllotreta striolata TaxID=444603 RepID=A0A9N9TNH6_PHYSR|nr:unnamed protein product [Phyllotreta striolata]
MDTSSPTEAKKSNLEGLSKEELIKKCTQLLQLAQKAKQSKLILQQENDQLKKDLDSVKSHLIEKNISVVEKENSKITKEEESQAIDKLKIEYENKLTICDNENISYKRQIDRLTHENEQLIGELDTIEKHSQQIQLEKDEIIAKLKEERDALKEIIVNFQCTIAEKDKNFNKINEELTAIQNKGDQSAENTLMLEENNLKLKQKIKFYHSKIVKFATISKDLRNSKIELLQLFKSYIDQVKDWKDQLDSAQKYIEVYLTKVNNENIILKEKLVELEKLQVKNSSISEENEKIKEIQENFESEMKILKDQYEDEKVNLEKILTQTKENNELLATENKELRENADNGTEQAHNTYKEIIKETNQTIKERENEIKLLRKENAITSRIKEELNRELEKLNSDKKFSKEQIETFKKTILDLQNQVKSLQELEVKSTEEIKHLADENKQLLAQNESLQEKLETHELSLQRRNDGSSQTYEALGNSNECEEQVSNLKRENSELLLEMNEMNQAIKERGETISKLEAHCEEVLKKLQVYEAQANKNVDNLTEKERIIDSLNNDIVDLKDILREKSEYADLLKSQVVELNDKLAEYEHRRSEFDQSKDKSAEKDKIIDCLNKEIDELKDRLNSNLNSSSFDDGMSTSTISRTEEINRMKDLEGSWEDRYGKLRNLAVKLKGKVRELTQNLTQQQLENEDLQVKLSSSAKTIQNMQIDFDKLQDDLEESKKESALLHKQLSGVAHDISKDKQNLANSDEIINSLRFELENKRKETEAIEVWKKQVGSKIQTLRKELETKKDIEAKLEAAEVALKNEIENHKHTKNLLEQSNNERKKTSVLNLEMQDYEKSVKESSKKLEQQLEEISKLKNQLETQKTTVAALREQNKLLEEKLAEKEENLNSLTSEISTYKKQITNLDNDISQKSDKISSLTRQLETSRAETEDLSTELTKLISEHQKTNSVLKSERDNLSGESLRLQQSLRDVQDELKLTQDAMKAVQDEYDGYKIRAQTVLRQNQSRDVGLEEKLSEEVAALVAQNLTLTNRFEDSKKTIESLENDNNKLTMELKQYERKVRELEEDCEDIKSQFADLSAKHEKSVIENAETLRNLKIHADTLSQCYRQQLSDQETRHNREIIELQSSLEKAPHSSETSPVLPTMMPRGEGEGSESIESNNSSSVHPVPLERLLGSNSEEEIERIKKKLQDSESKVAHLTSLLSDIEQDLVKHVQMNKLLKEEIRRQQRSEEREKHAENLEYMKNVVFKFITLNSCDERSRLVPVLNTILKLSPEETKLLNSVAAGGAQGNARGWSSYLPTWNASPKHQ